MATGIFMPKANAQENPPVAPKFKQPVTDPDRSIHNEEFRKELIATLERQKDSVTADEKYKLKQVLISIDKQLQEGKIDDAKAAEMRTESAKNAALNIDNKTAIIENKIQLAKRGEEYDYDAYQNSFVELGFGNTYDDRGSLLLGIHYQSNKPIKYDKRTYYNAVFAIGVNNTIGDGKTIGDEYKFGKSGYAEIGFALRTRLLKNSNALRLAYGLSLQENVLVAKDNRYFVNNNGVTELQPFSEQLKNKSYFRIDNLVVPIHLEFGPSKKKVYKDYFRYDTSNSFKVGLGGYIGYNLAATQRLRYEIDGVKRIDKIRTDYNVERFIYGLSGYIGLGPLSLYAKYDLNTVFSSSAFKDHNISFAFRVDL